MSEQAYDRVNLLLSSKEDMRFAACSYGQVVKISNRLGGEDFGIYNVGFNSWPSVGKTFLSNAILSSGGAFVKIMKSSRSQAVGWCNEFGLVSRDDANTKYGFVGGLVRRGFEGARSHVGTGTRMIEYSNLVKGIKMHSVITLDQDVYNERAPRYAEVLTCAPMTKTRGYDEFLRDTENLQIGT